MFDDNGYMINNNMRNNHNLSKVLLVVLGIFILGSVGTVFYDYYKSMLSIKERTKWLIENGSVLSNIEYVNNDGGYVGISNDDVLQNDKNGNIIATEGGKSKVIVSKNYVTGPPDDLYEDGETIPSTSQPPVTNGKKDKVTETYDSLKQGESKEIEVTVNEKIESINLNVMELNLYVGENGYLSYDISPSTATVKGVKWVSNDENIATVDVFGKVQAKSIGETTIKVETTDGSLKQASCKVKVLAKEEISKEIILKEKSNSIYKGETYNLDPVVTPNTISKSKIQYISSNEKVAIVDNKGIIKGLDTGNAVITLVIPEEKMSTTFNLTVKKKEVTDIVVMPQEVMLKQGEKVKLKTSVLPKDAEDQKLKYTTNNNKVATIDESGTITGVNKGTATITIQSNNNIRKTVKVTVNEKVVPVTKITAIVNNNKIDIGGTAKITTTISPSNATDKTIYYTSKNPDILTVDNTGLVTGKKGGTGQIIISSPYGVSTSLTIVVNPKLVETISLNKSNETMFVGESIIANVTVSPTGASNKVKWDSSNKSVATVTQEGLVVGVGTGTSTITATTTDGSQKKASFVVTVQNKTVTKKEIILKDRSKSMYVGESYLLSPVTTPDANLKNEIEYTSNNINVAKVDSTGKIIGVAAGTATITLSIPSQNMQTTFNVTILNKEVTGITIAQKEIEVEETKTAKLDVVITPNDATNKTLTYSSNNNGVATVKDGVITGIKKGTATITVRSNNNRQATVKVIVKERIIPVTKITATVENSRINMGSTTRIISTVSPSNATNKNLSYASNNTNIATVDSTGKVTGISAGTATITISSTSSVNTTVNVTVNPKLVTQISLSSTNNRIDIGGKTIIIATVGPSDATNKSVSWSTSNKGIATVSSTGEVTGVSAGIATITATANDGSGVKQQYKITVNPMPLKSIKLDKTYVRLYQKESTTVQLTVNPGNATIKSITWSSDNSSDNTKIATVSNGKITGKSAGKTTVSVTVKDSSGNTLTKKVTVRIEGPVVKKIKFNKQRVILDKNKQTKIYSYITSGSTATPDSNVKYSIDDSSIATVDSQGNITAKNEGSTYVTATADGKSESIPVYVNNPGDKVFVIDIQDHEKNTNLSVIGDAILIRSVKNNKYVYGMIDVGKSSSANRMISYLDDLGVTTLEWVLITHHHSDHYGGLLPLLQTKIKIKKLYLKEYDGLTSRGMAEGQTIEQFRKSHVNSFNSLVTQSRNKGIKIGCIGKWSSTGKKVCDNGGDDSIKKITLGSFTFYLYNRNSVYKALDSEDVCAKLPGVCNENANSIVAVAENGGRKILFTGDLDKKIINCSTEPNNDNCPTNNSKIKCGKDGVCKLSGTVVAYYSSKKKIYYAKSDCGSNANQKDCSMSKLISDIKKEHPTIDVLKIAHHGLAGNNPLVVLNKVSPNYAVVPNIKETFVDYCDEAKCRADSYCKKNYIDQNNKYNSPTTCLVYNRLVARNASVLKTDSENKANKIYFSGNGTVIYNISNSTLTKKQLNREEYQ